MIIARVALPTHYLRLHRIEGRELVTIWRNHEPNGMGGTGRQAECWTGPEIMAAACLIECLYCPTCQQPEFDGEQVIQVCPECLDLISYILPKPPDDPAF